MTAPAFLSCSESGANEETAAETDAAAPSADEEIAAEETVDDSIDWTDVLVSPTPTDGLTPAAEWAFLHAQAPAVLQGDPAAYLAVLQRIQPMDDLLPYVTALEVTPADPDTLRVVFSPRPDLMGAGARAYLCGMAVRIARDLFAALPVLTVTVSAGDALSAAFPRAQMNRVRFAFIDPAAFVAACGGRCDA